MTAADCPPGTVLAASETLPTLAGTHPAGKRFVVVASWVEGGEVYVSAEPERGGGPGLCRFPVGRFERVG